MGAGEAELALVGIMPHQGAVRCFIQGVEAQQMLGHHRGFLFPSLARAVFQELAIGLYRQLMEPPTFVGENLLEERSRTRTPSKRGP